MRRQLSLSVFFFIAFLCFHTISFAQDIHFKLATRWQDDLGGAILGMTQDSQGFLWFGTQAGLYKYDGYQYTPYHSKPSSPNSPGDELIECVASDKAGYIWLAPRRSGLDRLDPVTGLFTHFRHRNDDPGSLASDTVLAVLQDHDGTMWIGTQGGLDKFDSKTSKFLHHRNDPNDPSSLSCNTVRIIYEDKRGTIWVGTGSAFYGENPGFDGNGGLNRLNKETGKFIRYMHDERNPRSLIDNRVRAIFEDSRGVFWVGTAGDGLHTMDRAKGTFERHLCDSSHPDKLSRPPIKNVFSYGVDHITFITEDAKGRIWIGTYEAGINVYDPSTQKVTYYGADKNSKEKISDNHFWTAYRTKDNILWISTWENSLYKINPYENVLPHVNLGKLVRFIAEDDAHTLWLGTNRGLIHKDNSGKEEQFLFDKDSSSPANQISYIEKEDGKFWLITQANSLYLFDPATKISKKYSHQPGNINSLMSDTVFIVKKGTGNELWIGTIRGADLLDTKSGAFTHIQKKLKDTDRTSDNAVYSIDFDKRQNVWMGTNTGIIRFNEQTGLYKRYLSHFSINSFMEDSKGNLWCATYQGFFKYDEGTDNFSSFIDESGVNFSSPMFWMNEDREQTLWIAGSSGLIRLNKERKSAVRFGRNQGINVRLTTAAPFIRKNGKILIGDSSGYLEINPEFWQQNSTPPFINISNFLVNNTPILPSAQGLLSVPLALAKEIRLRHDQNTFSFEFLNIDFVSEREDTRILYMLQNYDDAWRKASDDKKAYYFSLPPGNYVFKVRALNAAGVAAEKDIAIIISPPWYKTWWAYTIYGICFLLLAFYANRIIRKRIIEKERMKGRERELTQAKEIEKAYHKLEQAHEALKSTQAQLIQSEKMASLGELIAGIAHEIQNPLNFVNNFSEVNRELIDEMQKEMEKGNFVEAKTISNNVKDNEEKIISHGRRADDIVKSMLQHSRASSGKKEATDINALSDEYLRLAYHGIRAKDKTFNAKFETDLDPSVGQINIVPQDFGRVILNLINNAFYAVGARGKTEGLGYDPKITVSTRKRDDKVLISVTDNGNGIPQNIVGKIFQPFFTTKPTGQGTGLGLSLAYDIIKAHGGEIKINTKEGEGSTFIIELPIQS